MLDKNYYNSYCKLYNQAYSYLKERSLPLEKVALEICNLRKYDPNRMSDTLIEAGFLKVPETEDLGIFSEKGLSDLGLSSSSGGFLLSGRYIFPVRDMEGNILTLIGWYPDEKRYITAPSALFSKAGLFYGMEQLSVSGIGKGYFLVEGIFDSLALRALGFRAVANMGINSSSIKEALYGVLGRIIAIPDVDKQGQKVLSKDKWGIPVGSSYLTWKTENQGKTSRVKDTDDLCRMYSREVATELFADAFNDGSRVITYKI